MLTRAKFLRLTGLTAAALAISPEALPKSNDGIVRVKSIYPFEETIERLKNDIAAKGIRFFSEIDQAKLAADAASSSTHRLFWCSAIRRSARNSSRQIPMRVWTGRFAFW
jgi:3'-phosphoadenosine 5'-phosphosulfate sulfotransferase (PAPS reductase)/FAD synthetase